MSTWTMAFLLEVPITANEKYCDVDLNPGGAPNVKEVSIAVQDYNDMVAVAEELEDALQVEDGTFTVTVGSTGRVTIARTGEFKILWKTGTHGSDNADTHIGTVLGFSDAADDTGAASYESDNQHTRGFYVTCGYNPKSDTGDRKVKSGPETFESMDHTAWRLTWDTGYIRVLELQAIPYDKFFSTDSPTNEAFEDWWETAAEGVPFQFCADSSDFIGSYQGQYCLKCRRDEDLLEGVTRQSAGEALYSKTLRMIPQV